MCFSKGCAFICLISLLLVFMRGSCTEFEVGATNKDFTPGWEVPPSKHPQLYNYWAQRNRFNVNDTLHFKYKKDSVMVVTDEEYDKCRSSEPIYYSNNGDTTIVLDRPGLFYFISGVTGHCERGQKMIVKVLDADVPQSGNYTASPETHKNGATHLMFMGFCSFPCFITFFIFCLVLIG